MRNRSNFPQFEAGPQKKELFLRAIYAFHRIRNVLSSSVDNHMTFACLANKQCPVKTDKSKVFFSVFTVS